LLEFKHSNGKDGPDLEDRRKARIKQIHLSNSAQTEKTPKIRRQILQIPGYLPWHHKTLGKSSPEWVNGTLLDAFASYCGVVPGPPTGLSP
jgi:hypothetical protein